MTKIRMNTELRNKLFNKIKHVFENESTQEREDYLQARENVDPEGNYVKKWVPEISNLPKEFLHKPWELNISIKYLSLEKPIQSR